MPDALIRDLEREVLAGGGPHAEARLLVARLRIGKLDHHGLALAAHLGHEPARLALGEPSSSAWSAPCTTSEELASAVTGLGAFGREVLVRAAVVAAELAGPPAVAMGVAAPEFYDLLLDTARAWLACPCPAHELDAARRSWGPMPYPFRGPGNASKFACSAIANPLDQATHCAAVAVELAALAVPVAVLREAVRSTLVGWSLRPACGLLRFEVRSAVP